MHHQMNLSLFNIPNMNHAKKGMHAEISPCGCNVDIPASLSYHLILRFTSIYYSRMIVKIVMHHLSTFFTEELL